MIGIFDSGLGGLTVLKEIRKVLPTNDLMYFGDTAHVPYGNRSDEVIFQLTQKAVEFLFSQGAEYVVVACNTASARALPKLLDKYKNISGVIEPVVNFLIKKDFDKIGVIGTRATINSNVYKNKILEIKPEIEVTSVATPLLVPLVEENWIEKVETEAILLDYLKVLRLKQVQALILGCTHYPMLLVKIRNIMGQNCFVPNPAEIVAQDLINNKKIQDLSSGNGNVRYSVSDLTDNFQQIATEFLDEKVILELVKL